MKKYILILICFVSYLPSLFSQQDKDNTKPLELPAFIIEGVEQLNIRSGMKQAPAKPMPLDVKDLDSLNTYDKQAPALLEVDELPTHYVTKKFSKGFIKGNYGLFNTPSIEGAYQFDLANFDIYAKAGFEHSSGDAQYSDYNKFFIDINSDYIADDKFFIFGGSRTHTGLLFNTKSYNLYGFNKDHKYYIDKSSDYFDRNATQFKLNIASEGTYENALFNVGANINISKFTNDKLIRQYTISDAFSHNYLRGYIDIKNYWKNFLIGGNILLDFENLDANSINFYQAVGTVSYFNKDISTIAKVGFQFADNSQNNNRAGLLIEGNLEYRIDKSLTLKLNLNSGLEKTEFEEIVQDNPYMSNRTFIDYTYNILKLDGAIWFHPTTKLSITGGAELRLADRLLNYELDSLAEFTLTYYSGSIFNIFGECFYAISSIDKIIGNIHINLNSLESDKHLTYTPLLKLSTTYARKWFEKLTTNVSLEYNGQRYTSTSDNDIVNGYFMLNVSADYKINKFTINLTLNNLTNSTIYIWDKYRERSLFASLGLMWQF